MVRSEDVVQLDGLQLFLATSVHEFLPKSRTESTLGSVPMNDSVEKACVEDICTAMAIDLDHESLQCPFVCMAI